MKQFDETFRHLLITGNGTCKVWKYFDSRQRLGLGDVRQGSLIGVTQVLFDTNPVYTIETQSYCSVGVVANTKFWELITAYPDLKKAFKDQVIQNPFDSERELFVQLCKKSVDYLSDADEDMLRQLFYRSKQQFYDIGQVVFDVGDCCDCVYYVLQGVIDIVISDGYAHHKVLDVLGKGSFIGISSVLKEETWAYKAVNNSTLTTRVLIVSNHAIQSMAVQFAPLQTAIKHFSEHLEIYGLPQIDYQIRMLRTSTEEIQGLIINF